MRVPDRGGYGLQPGRGSTQPKHLRVRVSRGQSAQRRAVRVSAGRYLPQRADFQPCHVQVRVYDPSGYVRHRYVRMWRDLLSTRHTARRIVPRNLNRVPVDVTLRQRL